jgi:selenocysteine lyase/cysteine desulfurase
MSLDRRDFLMRTGLLLTAEMLSAATARAHAPRRSTPKYDTWPAVRALFDLDRRYVHLGGLLLASHPRPVRESIERHRRGLDANPVHYLYDNRWDFEADVLSAAAEYLGAEPRDIALTDSTTMGVSTLYAGIALADDQDVLTTVHCHYCTRESWRLRADRTRASVRSVALYNDLNSVSKDEIVAAVVDNLGPKTRVVALTWVHSSTGLKLPIREIADALALVNAKRDEADRVLLCVDGVHGFGIEDVTVADLGCDFFVAGCHKWLLGPRGTGIVWGRPAAWEHAAPTIPSFTGHESPGSAMTPGGFHSFEHRWALADAFRFQQAVGKARVAARIHDLAGQVKEGLASIPGVKVVTPTSPDLSAGLVCFDIEGVNSDDAAEALRKRRVIASVAPYANRYLRFSPGIFNSHSDVERALRAVRAVV